MTRSEPVRPTGQNDKQTQGLGTSRMPDAAKLVKSRQRVADHGEVFTPAWMVDDMLNLVKDETERIDSRVLEPACGSGNFLVSVLQRKLATVLARYGKQEFEKNHFALLAVMCTYGIELLEDNAAECRANLAEMFATVVPDPQWRRAAEAVLAVNIVQANALTMATPDGSPILFAEWAYLGKGKYQRRDFRYEALTQRATFEGTLFSELDDDDIFIPTRTYPPLTVQEIAA